LNIEQILQELESQKSSIERAIAALNGVAAEAYRPKLHTAVTRADGRKADNRKHARTRSRPTYTDDFRRQVIMAVRDGMSFGQAAKKFGTTWFTVREWVNSGRFEPAKQNIVRKNAVAKKRSVSKKAALKRVARKAATSRKAAKNSAARKRSTTESETPATA